ncbi:hypothetical protein ACFV0R_27970 [Streptomyces sp. NPDC059578]|uniref:hypothetical protein n=1 Tax=Streptomyces sp. NPDC059578 TaxID=3346874 RepID=UPI0036A678D7
MLDDPVPLYVAGVVDQCAYRTLVFAQGRAVGTPRRGRTVLGSFVSPYPGRVLRGLRVQALR